MSQSNDGGRVEPFRPSNFGAGRSFEAPGVSLPDAEAYRLGAHAAPGSARVAAAGPALRRERYPDAEETRNSVFEQLVTGDEDVAGLIAYSIYKQNKRDWLKAFELAKSRAPTLDEEAAYTIGEATPRRLAMYRHIAQETLTGQGPVARLPELADAAHSAPLVTQASGEAASAPAIRVAAALPQHATAAKASRKNGSLPALLAYGAVLALAGFGLWMALRALFPALGH